MACPALFSRESPCLRVLERRRGSWQPARFSDGQWDTTHACGSPCWMHVARFATASLCVGSSRLRRPPSVPGTWLPATGSSSHRCCVCARVPSAARPRRQLSAQHQRALLLRQGHQWHRRQQHRQRQSPHPRQQQWQRHRRQLLLEADRYRGQEQLPSPASTALASRCCGGTGSRSTGPPTRERAIDDGNGRVDIMRPAQRLGHRRLPLPGPGSMPGFQANRRCSARVMAGQERCVKLWIDNKRVYHFHAHS